MAKQGTVLSRLLHRLTSEDEALDAQVLTENSARQGACCCSQAELGEKVTVAGRIRSVEYTPSEHAPSLSAELYDGTGSVRLVWLGRRRIPGIEPGRILKVEGRVADHDGDRTIFNPWYELQRT